MRRPLNTFRYISSNHGQPTGQGHFGKHLGTDYSTAVNTPVYAPCAGIIIGTPNSTTVGQQVYLVEDGNGRIHRFLHLNQEFVSVDQHVTEGQLIAMSGNTGTNSTGAHLHWDVRKANTTWNGSFANYYNPESLLVAAPPKPDSNLDAGDVGKTLFLKPTVSSWRVYYPGTKTVRATLNPAKYGGLSYRILALDSIAQRAIIQTTFYGRVSCPVDTDAEIR